MCIHMYTYQQHYYQYTCSIDQAPHGPSIYLEGGGGEAPIMYSRAKTFHMANIYIFRSTVLFIVHVAYYCGMVVLHLRMRYYEWTYKYFQM